MNGRLHNEACNHRDSAENQMPRLTEGSLPGQDSVPVGGTTAGIGTLPARPREVNHPQLIPLGAITAIITPR